MSYRCDNVLFPVVPVVITQLQISSSPHCLLNGTSVNIKCVNSGFPRPEIVFFRGTQQITLREGNFSNFERVHNKKQIVVPHSSAESTSRLLRSLHVSDISGYLIVSTKVLCHDITCESIPGSPPSVFIFCRGKMGEPWNEACTLHI